MSISEKLSASHTLEYAFNDYSISSAAAKLGRSDIAKRYATRSLNWRNLWDAKLQCIRPRYADGRWLEKFDCAHEYPDPTAPWWDHPLYDGSSRHYSHFVPHDVAGLQPDRDPPRARQELRDRGARNVSGEPLRSVGGAERQAAQPRLAHA